MSATVGGTSVAITQVNLTITLTRGADTPGNGGISSFVANATISTPNGTINATASGEAILEDSVWKFRGSADYSGPWSGRGGWGANISIGVPGLSDDSLVWRFDGLLSV
ncbi:MAG: hypothetical protein O2815_10115 [Actinomycetota bacterium]|nr:hypothetical protein [Actinomycetota bacterium]